VLFSFWEELSLLWLLYGGLLWHKVILTACYHFAHEILVNLPLVVILISLFNLFDANLKHLFHHVQVFSRKIWRRRGWGRVETCWGRQGSILEVWLRLINIARHELRIVYTLVSYWIGNISGLADFISALIFLIIGRKFSLLFDFS
jgi:hypothetical protein